MFLNGGLCRRRQRVGPSVMVLVASLGLLGGCDALLGGGDEAGRLHVVSTTSIVDDVVRRVGGDAVAPERLMGPGVDPHLYKPSEGDVRKLQKADVVVYNGLHLEGKMVSILERMDQAGKEVVAVAETIAEDVLIPAGDYASNYDPHVWFDVGLWRQAVRAVRDGLVSADPDRAEGYRARADAYLAELDELNAWVRERIVTIPERQRVLVTAHDAFAYFGRAYGMEVKGLLGISTDAEAGTGDVKKLATFIAERRIPAIFVETTIPERYVEALRQAVASRGYTTRVGGSLYSDALGSRGTPAETYVGTVRHNVDTIVGALAEDGS